MFLVENDIPSKSCHVPLMVSVMRVREIECLHEGVCLPEALRKTFRSLNDVQHEELGERMPIRYDMHSHLDFANDCKAIARDAQGLIVTLNSTVTPAAYVSACEKFEDFDNVSVALGLHPWWVANDRISEVDIAHFEELLQTCNLIGEIGLDFHKSRKNSMTFQIEVFQRILDAIANASEPKLVFLHSVKATGAMLDMIEKSGALRNSTFVFHWFQGSHDEFGRAMSLGCRFSIGMRMLAQENGRLFAEAVPDEILLAETDNPDHEGMDWSVGEWLQEMDNTVYSLAELRNVEIEEVEGILEDNSEQLLREFNTIAATV